MNRVWEALRRAGARISRAVKAELQYIAGLCQKWDVLAIVGTILLAGVACFLTNVVMIARHWLAMPGLGGVTLRRPAAS